MGTLSARQGPLISGQGEDKYINVNKTILQSTVIHNPYKEIHKSKEIAEEHVKYFIAYLKNPRNAADRLYLRAFSNYNGEQSDINILSWAVNQLHLEPAATPIKEIHSQLYVIDIRNYGWNQAAFSAVARRETYFREGFINPALARELRALTGTEQDPNTLHLEAIVRADWFFRDTMESDRSPSYYDLLFAKFRFIPNESEEIEIETGEYKIETITEDWAGGIDPVDGKYYAPGKYERDKKVKIKKKIPKSKSNGFKFVKFPKNEKDFEKAFGVDKVFDFIKESGINTQKGAVVEGGEKGVSIVSRQNRLIAFTNSPFGMYSKTFDVKQTSGKRDFAETLNKNFIFDVGEILADTPAGGLACLLVNAAGDIVEVADNRFATDKSDITLDARVRTPGSCFICHEKGFIKPNNLIKEMVEKGIDIKFKNKRDALDAKSFFLSWDKKFDFWQEPHITLSENLFHGEPSKRATTFKLYRDRYDSEINLDKACIEQCVSKETFIRAAAKSTKARLNNLLVGITMPRSTWEVDDFIEMTYLLSLKDVDYDFRFKGNNLEYKVIK